MPSSDSQSLVSVASLLPYAIVFVAALLASASLTYFMIGYANRHGMQDIPNERSSHTRPVPRGGGLAFVLVFLLGILLLWATGSFSRSAFVLPFVAGGALTAGAGFWDDRRSLPARVRIVFHFLAAFLLFFGMQWVLGEGWSLALGSLSLSAPVLKAAVCALLTVWLINLYNFMDGIDGIAGIEALTASLALVLAFWIGGAATGSAHDAEWVRPCLLLGGAAAGFLVFNWSPARIFMGDVGSGFLGYVFAGLILYGEASGRFPLVTSLILLGAFIADATYTLIVRFFRGEKVYAAHRDHAYQHAVQRGWSHRSVSGAFGLVNLLWLAPLALLSLFHREQALWILVIAYLPLFGVARWLNAGVRPT